MTVDYDLVIIGSSRAGIYAAKNAVQLQARVALVTQCDELFLPDDVLINQSFNQVGQLNYRLANNFLASARQTSDSNTDTALAEAASWAMGIESVMQSHNSLANLAALGVDVIAARGEFCRLPQFAFQVGKRTLRSHNFLLATGSNFGSSSIDEAGCLTLRELWQRDLSDLGQNIAVVGGEPLALELAQTLARFGRQVILIIEQQRILPQEDLDIALLIQAQLEASGIEVYTGSSISQIKTIDGQKWLQLGDLALTADEIITVDRRQPNIKGLNLAGVGVKYDLRQVHVNRKLQTTNPKIYACGDLIGGYSLPHIENYETAIVLKNTLFFSWYKTNYYALPWAVLIQPNLARVGLTEWQAKQQYDEDIYVIKEDFGNVAQKQILDREMGICKLLVRHNGEILGCSLIGDRAAELITTIALMMQHKIRLRRNPMAGLTSLSIPAIYPTMAEILENACHNFYQQKLQRDAQQLGRLRSWFSRRKN